MTTVMSDRPTTTSMRPIRESLMATRKRKYSPGAGKDVESEMRRYNRGTARSGRGGRGGK